MISWIVLVLGIVGALYALCALVPVPGRTTSRLSMWHLVFGLPGSELSAVLITIGIALAVAGAWLGAASHWPGRIGLLLHALAVLGLLWAMWRARSARPVFDAAFRAALGAGYESGIAPSRRALLADKVDPARWWRPFAYRHPAVNWHRH